MPSWPGIFQLRIFLGSLLSSLGVCSPQSFLRLILILFLVIYQFNISVKFSVSPFYFKIVLFLLHPVVYLSLSILHRLVGRSLFRYFGMTFLFLLFDPIPNMFNVLSFANIFWFISPCCIVRLICGLILAIILSYYSFKSFSHQRQLTVFHLSLCENKSPQADLNKNVVRSLHLSSYFQGSSPSTNPLEIVPSAPFTISITATFILRCFVFFSSFVRSIYLSLFSFSFNFSLWSARTA